MIGDDERGKMLAVPLCGYQVVERLSAIGVERLGDLCGDDAFELMELVNVAAGYTVWRPPMAILALQNLIEAAEREAQTGAARHVPQV